MISLRIKIYSFWIIMAGIITGLLIWRNKYLYPTSSNIFIISKSIIELFLIAISTFYAPFILVGLITAYISNLFKTGWIKFLVSIIASIGLGSLITAGVTELIVLLSIFAIDIKTGKDTGVLSKWNQTAYPSNQAA